MKPIVTIGLCVKNASKIVKTALKSISIQDYPHEFLKLVIVDDGSSDSTLDVVMDFAKKTDVRTVVTSSKGRGLGVSRQIVLDKAEGDYIVWVDDDFVLPKNFIRNSVEFMEKNPSVGAARGIYVPIKPKTIIGIIEYGVIISPDLMKPQIIGAGGSIFRIKVLKNAGGFDIRIKGAGEDIDVSRRIRELGWKLATISNVRLSMKFPAETLKALLKKHKWYGYGNHFLYHKYKDQWLLNQYFPPIILFSGLRGSYLIWRITNNKKAFFFLFLYFLIEVSNFIGFIRSHLEGYGHPNN